MSTDESPKTPFTGYHILPAKTEEELRKDIVKFLSERESTKPTSDTRIAEIEKLTEDAVQKMISNFSLYDSGNLNSLRRYWNGSDKLKLSQSERLDLINWLIEWANDDALYNANAIQRSVENDINSKKSEIAKLEKELETLKAALDTKKDTKKDT
jgi:hypothetical protein